MNTSISADLTAAPDLSGYDTSTGSDLLDHLMHEGYEPQDDRDEYEIYDLVASGAGIVRVMIAGGDDVVCLLTQHEALVWKVTVSDQTPIAVLMGVIEAAERELADRRGGPVTQTQADAVQRSL